MQHKLADIINKAELIEINMERADCTQHDGSVYRFSIDGDFEVWYVDGNQMVELGQGGCVTAQLADDGEHDEFYNDSVESEIEIYFAMMRPFTDEDMK